MVRRICETILIIAFIMVFSGTLKSQYGSFGLTDARQLGMGNTYATNSRELYAAGKNPSLLAERNSDRRLDILFPNLSARTYNITKVTQYLNDLFAQRPIDIIGNIDGSLIRQALENGGSLYLGLQIGYLGAGYTHNEKTGSFSFVMKDYLTGSLKLPQKIVDYYNGEIPQKDVYFRDFRFEGAWTRAYELSYGKVFRTDPSSGILAIYSGIGLKYLNGYLYREVEFTAGAGYQEEDGIFYGSYNASSKSAHSDDIDIGNAFAGKDVVSHVPFMHPVGKGFAADLGLTLLLDPGVKVGVSLTDIGFMDWKGKTRSTSVNGVIRIDSTFDIDDIDSLSNVITIIKESEQNFRTQPPGAVHLGFCFMVDHFVRNFPGRMNIALELHQGLNRTMENPEYSRIAMGLDWKPGKNWPVFLTGMTTNRINRVDWTLGIGYELKFMEIYISSPDFGSVLEGKSLETLSLSLCWHFIKGQRKGE